MSLRWNGEFKKVEDTNEWSWWALFVAVIIMEIITVLKMSGKI